jgi:hypothetical protein
MLRGQAASLRRASEALVSSNRAYSCRFRSTHLLLNKKGRPDLFCVSAAPAAQWAITTLEIDRFAL